MAVEVNERGFPKDPEKLEDFLSSSTPRELRLQRRPRLLQSRADARALTTYVFGDPPPDHPTPAEAEAMKQAEEAKIAAIKNAVARLSRPANPGTPPGIDELTGLGFGGRQPEE